MPDSKTSLNAVDADETRAGSTSDISKTRIAPEGHEQWVLQSAMQSRDVAPPGFTIESELGRGGMGVVYLARQSGLNRTVALKMILGHSAENPIRFLAEAEAIASVKHPQVVEVYQFGEVNGRPYLALEYCPGGSLDDVLKTGVTPEAAAELIAKIADGVQAAHEQGIVHRDLKPHNVLFTAEGMPKVTDFGLAKKTGGPDLTKTNAILGTPAYMSPEQAQGGTKFVGPPADVWSLGVILYELLTRSRPFEGEATWDVLSAVMSGEFIAPRKKAAGVPRDLELICLKCLHTDPRDRYATAGELADDLRRFVHGEPVSVRPAGNVERLTKWSRKNRTLAASLAAIAATLLIGIGVSTWQAILASRAAERAHIAEIAEGKRAEEAGLAAERAQKAERAEFTKAEEARKATAKADEQSKKLALQVLETRRFLDLARLREAQALYKAHLVEYAREALDAIAPENRETAWGLLKRICEGSLYASYGHDSVIYGVAWSPDGNRIATASEDNSVRIWDAATGLSLRKINAHELACWSVAWSPDGKRLASASADKTVKIWDAENGKLLTTLKGHTNVVLSVAWSPDGKYLASASADKVARIWDIRTETTLRQLKGHTDTIWSIAWSPDGKNLVTGGLDFTLRIWDASTGESENVLKGHTSTVRCVAWSPDGSKIASGSVDNDLRIWDAVSGTFLFGLAGHYNGVWSVAWSPDGRRIASGSEDKTVRIWDVESGKHKLLLGHENGLECVAWSPDGRRIASGGWDHSLRVWDAETGGNSRELKGHTNFALDVAWSPDGKHFASAGQENAVRIWDAATGACKHICKHTKEATGVAWSPDGRRVVSTGFDQLVRFWDAETGKQENHIRAHEGIITCVAWSPDGKRIVTGSGDKTLRIWDVATGKRLLECSGHTDTIWGVAWSLDGERLASASEDKTIRIWNAETGKSQFELTGHSSWVLSVSWSPDGRFLASGGAHKNLRIWDALTGTLVKELKGHTSAIETVAFSPDGRQLASASDDGTIRLWDTATWQSLIELQSGELPVNGVAWSPDGKSLVACDSAFRLRVWEPHREPPLKLLFGHDSALESIDYSADGRWIVSFDSEQKKIVWDARTGTRAPLEPIPELAPPGTVIDTGFDHLLFGSEILMIKKGIPTEELVRRRAVMAPDPVWHREQAALTEKASNWYAAAFHLRHLSRLVPDDEKVKTRLAAAEKKRKQ